MCAPVRVAGRTLGAGAECGPRWATAMSWVLGCRGRDSLFGEAPGVGGLVALRPDGVGGVVGLGVGGVARYKEVEERLPAK